MLEQFVKHPFHLAQYRNGLDAEVRSRSLAHLIREGGAWQRL
jgi:hypothetical protein